MRKRDQDYIFFEPETTEKEGRKFHAKINAWRYIADKNTLITESEAEIQVEQEIQWRKLSCEESWYF